MMVVVNEQNIIEYDLPTLTGKTKDELLALAELANEAGRAYKVMVPDTFNVFDHVESTKAVEHGERHVHDYPVESRRGGDDIHVIAVGRHEADNDE